MREKTIVISLYIKGYYFGTSRFPVPELKKWQEALEGAFWLKDEECVIADYYTVYINKIPKGIKE